MEATGEKYTLARRAVLNGDGSDGTWADPVRTALRPGTVTAVIAGGGMNNLGLVMPQLIALLDTGHQLMTVLSERRGLLNVPSPFDFVVARGVTDSAEVDRLLQQDDWDRLADLVSRGADGITFVDGPVVPSVWREELEARRERDLMPVLWVQDIQVGPPCAIGRGDEFEQIPRQIEELRFLARGTGAIVALGHCMILEDEEGWRPVVDAVDEAFVIDADLVSPEEPAEPRGATILHYRDGQSEGVFRRKLDTNFCRWRRVVLRRQ